MYNEHLLCLNYPSNSMAEHSSISLEQECIGMMIHVRSYICKFTFYDMIDRLQCRKTVDCSRFLIIESCFNLLALYALTMMTQIDFYAVDNLFRLFIDGLPPKQDCRYFCALHLRNQTISLGALKSDEPAYIRVDCRSYQRIHTQASMPSVSAVPFSRAFLHCFNAVYFPFIRQIERVCRFEYVAYKHVCAPLYYTRCWHYIYKKNSFVFVFPSYSLLLSFGLCFILRFQKRAALVVCDCLPLLFAAVCYCYCCCLSILLFIIIITARE